MILTNIFWSFLVRLTRFFTSENEDTAREHGTSWHTDSGATGITVPPAQGAARHRWLMMVIRGLYLWLYYPDDH